MLRSGRANFGGLTRSKTRYNRSSLGKVVYMRSRRFWIAASPALGLLSLALYALAQDKPATQDSQTPPATTAKPPAKRETVARPLSEKERKRREARLRKELEGPYKKWLTED